MKLLLEIALLICGTGFMTLAAVGIVKMPDLYTRMHASSKAASLGVCLVLIAAAFHFQQVEAATKVLITIFFIFLTAAVAAHLLGRASYRLKVKQSASTHVDEGQSMHTPSRPSRHL